MLTVLRWVHLALLLVWFTLACGYRVSLARARRRGPQDELTCLRRWLPRLAAQHASLFLALAVGLWLLYQRGYSLGHPGWLGLKVGLSAALLAPLEGFHAWIVQAWLRPGLARTASPPASKELRRALAMQDMLAMLAGPLLGMALPLLLWLSLWRPF